MYYHKITEYGIKCLMHAHHVAPRAPPNRGELYRRKTLFLDDFPIFFFIQMGPGPTHPHPNYFWIFGIFLTLQSPLLQHLITTFSIFFLQKPTRSVTSSLVCVDTPRNPNWLVFIARASRVCSRSSSYRCYGRFNVRRLTCHPPVASEGVSAHCNFGSSMARQGRLSAKRRVVRTIYTWTNGATNEQDVSIDRYVRVKLVLEVRRRLLFLQPYQGKVWMKQIVATEFYTNTTMDR